MSELGLGSVADLTSLDNIDQLTFTLAIGAFKCLNKNAVFVLDTVARGAERHYNPCNPVPPAAARKLLSHGSSAVFRQYPFTIILKEKNA